MKFKSYVGPCDQHRADGTFYRWAPCTCVFVGEFDEAELVDCARCDDSGEHLCPTCDGAGVLVGDDEDFDCPRGDCDGGTVPCGCGA
jgi:hypothetical protein